METNGLTSAKFSEFSLGDKFIISPKGDKETVFTKPTEITIRSIIKTPEDPNDTFSGETYIIETVDGQILNIDAAFAPICKEFNIYLNWKTYISIFFETIESKKYFIRTYTKFVSDFESFLKEFIAENPEKII